MHWRHAGAIGVAAVAIAAPTASAVFIETVLVDLGDVIGDGTTRTFRVMAMFDNPADRLLRIEGDEDVAPLVFGAGDALVQNAGPFSGLFLEDTPSIFDAGNDSWVTVGINDAGTGSDTLFTSGFLGGDGVTSVIDGDAFEQRDGGGYFDANPATPENGGSVLIAQFTFPATTEWFTYSGTVAYIPGIGEQFVTQEPFEVALVPGPAPLGLMVVAGMVAAGARRRRL